MNLHLKKTACASMTVFAFLFIVVCIAPVLGRAATPTNYTVLAPLPCIPTPASKDAQGRDIPGSEVTCRTGTAGTLQLTVDFKTYVQYAFNLLIAIAAVLSVLYIVWGGLEYMTSETVPGKGDGLAKVRHAVEGLLLVLVSYLLLRTIDPRLVQIPTSLVAELDCPNKPALKISDSRCNIKNTTGNFLTQLQSQAANYIVQNQELKRQISDAKGSAAEAEANLEIANQKITGLFPGSTSEDADMLCIENSNDSAVAIACRERQKYIETKNSGKSEEIGLTGQAAILGELKEGTAFAELKDINVNPSYIKDRMATINTSYNNAVAAMNQISNPPDQEQLQVLSDARNYALGMLQMQQDVLAGPSVWSKASSAISAAGKASLIFAVTAGASTGVTPSIYNKDYSNSQQRDMATKVQADLKKYVDNIKDPEIKNQLIDNVNSAVQTLGS